MISGEYDSSGSRIRERFLDCQTMLRGAASDLIENRLFMPPAEAASASTPFIGTLKLKEAEMSTRPGHFKAKLVLGQDPKIFPAADLPFFTVGDDLVPAIEGVRRYGSMAKGRSYWDIIVQPGKVWAEAADEGWNRAAFPLALVHSQEGETHNGVAMFLYKDGLVSNLHYQITQQTTPGNIEDYFTAWGSLDVKYDPAQPDGLPDLISTWKAASAAAIPMKPWADLEAKVGADSLADFDSDIPPEEIVLDGLWYDGQFYYKNFSTPVGPLPYAVWQRFGVWSVTKTMANATAMLRLAQKYGPEVFGLKLTEYVTELKGLPGWDRVEFGHALSMTTAMGTGSAKTDPNDINDGYVDDYYAAWYEARTAAEKIAAQAKDARPYPWEPGDQARYRDFDQFVLGVAMDRFLKSREGPAADIWTLLCEEVFKPLGIYYAPINRTLERKGPGCPLMSFGFYPTVSDMLKIALLYQNEGRSSGKAILHSAMMADLKAGPVKRGLPTGNTYHTYYHKTLWHGEYTASDGRTHYYPLMVGWGGNWVMLFPKGIVGLRIAKNWAPASRDWLSDPLAGTSASLARVAFKLAGLQ